MPPTVPEQPGAAADRRPTSAVRPVRREPADRSAAGPEPTGRSGRAVARRSGGDGGSGRAPLVVAAAVATIWAALLSYLPVAVVLGGARLAEGAGGVGEAIRLGLAGWLLGHGVPLRTDAGPFGLAPLAVVMLAAWRVSRAGVHVSRAMRARRDPRPRRAFIAAGAVGVGYGLLGALAAVVLGDAGPSASVPRAAVTLAVFGALAGACGALHNTGALGTLIRATPVVLRDGLRTGVIAALLLLGAGAGVAGLAVAIGGGEAADMIGAYRTGVLGQTGITLISLGYAPNAAVWAASYLLGPGFAVGGDTVVRSSEVSIGALPAVPLFAGLPNGPLDGLSDALLAVPLIAAMAAGWLLARRAARVAADRQEGPPSWARLLGAAAVSGPVAGLALGAAAFLSGGPLGGGRLAQVGPTVWQVVAAATAVVLVGTVIGAVATRAVTRN